MTVLQNDPFLWRDKLPVHDPRGHKYDRGVAVIFGARKMTGATRLAARACARMGAGLVRVVAPDGAGDIYRATLTEEIIVEDKPDFKGLDDPRIRAVLMGPGWNADDAAGFDVPSAGKQVILDAGAIGLVQRYPGAVITPHEGEFARAFPDLSGEKIQNSVAASRRINGVVVLKGAQTVIAHGDDVIVQDRAVPELATGGTGDVLAGMIAGLVAQDMAPLFACAAAVWIHAQAAARFGPGLVAADLPDVIPAVLKGL